MKLNEYHLGVLFSAFLICLFSFTYVTDNQSNFSTAPTSLQGYAFNFDCEQGNGLTAEYFYDTHLGRKALTTTERAIDMNLYHRSPKPNLRGDQFSIRWSGGIYAPETGIYTFHMRVDDGARIWIDGQLLLDEWGLNAPTDFRFKVNMTQGTMHAIKVEYVQYQYNEAVAQLRWSLPNSFKSAIPTNYLYTCPPSTCFANPQAAAYFESQCANEKAVEEFIGQPFDENCRAGKGLTAEYFADTRLRKSVLKTIEPTIDFFLYRQRPKARVPADKFSIRWTGGLYTPTPGQYTFYFTVDDGARIWIDDKLVLDEWDLHEATTFQFEAKMNGGEMHNIRIEYAQFMFNEAVAKFEWKTPNGDKTLVPVSNLYPVADVTCEEPTLTENMEQPTPAVEVLKEEKKKKDMVRKGIIAAAILAILTVLKLKKSVGSSEN